MLYLIWRELSYLVKVRQAYLLTAWNASRISSRTILFTNVPDDYLTHRKLHTIFGGVSQVWLVSDFADLEEHVDDMSDTALKLEGAEIKLIRQAVKKAMKGKENNGQVMVSEGSLNRHPGTSFSPPRTGPLTE